MKFSDRPNSELMVDRGDRVDFGEPIIPEYSWGIELDADKYEVEQILDVLSGRKPRYGRIHKQYLVRWKVYSDLTWIDEADRNCGAVLQEFDRNRVSRNRFEVMQSHEEGTVS